MEACVMKPEVKKKPKPLKPPPKPAEIKRNDPERLEKPSPLVPQRPSDAELSQTQYRMKRAATTNTQANGNLIQRQTKEKPSETPVVPPRPTEKELNATSRYSQHRRVQAEDKQSTEVAEVPKDEADFKQSNQTGVFRRSQKEKTPSFTSYVIDDFNKEDKSDSVPAEQAPGNKLGGLKSSPKASREPSPDPSTEEAGSEKEQPAEENKQEKNAEPKQEKGGFFSGILKKSNKTTEDTSAQDNLSELSASSDSLSENKEKGGIFSGMFKNTPKPTESAHTDEGAESLHSELSASTDSLSENKEKGGLFSGLLRKTPKTTGEENLLAQKNLSASNDSLSEAANTKDREAQKELSASNDDLSENNTTKEKNIFSNMFKKPQKPAEGAAADKELEVNSENQLSGSCENLFDPSVPKEKKGGLVGIFKRSASIDTLFDEELNKGEDMKLSASWENLLEATTSKEKTGGLAGIFKKSPKPVPCSIATKDPLSDSKDLSASCDSLIETAEDDLGELSTTNDNLSEATNTAKDKKGGFAGIIRRTPKTVEHQESEDMEAPEGGGHRRTINKKRRVVSFRVKKTLPKIPRLNLTQSSDKMLVIEETVELQELNPAQESPVEVQPVEMAAYPTDDSPLESEQESNELMEWWKTVTGWTDWNETSNFQEGDEEMVMEQVADRVYMAARLFVHLFNQRGASLQHRILELLALADAADQFHKKTVTAAVGGGVASVAGSVATITGLILAPFTFGASIIVTAVGISVATAGSITSATANITDTVHSNMDRKKLEKMIQSYQEEIKDIRECLEFVQDGMDTLQEWDFEKYSESAAKKALNHNLKHVMKEGGRAGKALMINTNKLISTVQVLGAAGGAVKAAQAISVTTGVMSALFLALDVFFLAKDSHKLRKGAKTKFATKIRGVCKELQDGLLELNKVKTQLQKTMDGIEVEEYEEIEEVEVEVDDDLESDPKKLAELEQELDLLEEKLDKKVEEEQKKIKEMEKENLKSKKEKREEKSTKEKGEPEETKNKEEETGEKDAKKEEKKESKKGKGEEESKVESKLEKISDEEKETVKAVKEEVLKEQSQKGRKDKETDNRITAGKEVYESKRDRAKEDNGTNKKTEKEKEKNKTGKEQEEIKSRSGDSKREDRSGKAHSETVKTERESERSKSSREDETVMNKEKEAESGNTRRHSSRSDKHRPHRSERGSGHETKETERGSSSRDGKQSDRTESGRRTEEDRGVRDWRAEMAKSREEKRESQEGRESKRETERGMKREDYGKSDVRKESHRSHEAATRRERPERERRSSREESDSKRSHHRRGTAEHDGWREGGEEKRGSRVESARRQFERAVGEEEKEERGKRTEDGESQRRDRERRVSDRDREHTHHSRRWSRARANALLEDGLNI